MNERDKSLLLEMRNNCIKISERVNRYSIDEGIFVEDTALQDMLLMPIFQIGELASSLSHDFCSSNAQIPWSAIKGFRNIIAHDYGAVDPFWAWNTISCDIPQLYSFLDKQLADGGD